MAVNFQEMKRMYDVEGPDKALQEIASWVKKGELRLRDITSIQEMFIDLVPDGEQVVRSMSRKKSGGLRLQEAAGATDTGTFANIFGQITYAEVKEQYESPELLWPQLFDSRQTKWLKGEKIPGVGKIGDKGGKILEGDPYPRVGPNEEWYDRPALEKNGFTTGVTREVIIEDNTGLVMQQIDTGIEGMQAQAEKRALDIATGQVNTYKRNGTATNTYLTSGSYTNSFTSNALSDFQSLNTIFVNMSALTDPNTGEPIRFEIEGLLVPPALNAAAFHAQRMTSVEKVDNTVSATTIRTIGANPYSSLIKSVLVSQYVKKRTSSDTTWFGGRFKKALRRYYAWDIETEMRSDGERRFTHDIYMEFKVSVMDCYHAYEPRYIFKSVA